MFVAIVMACYMEGSVVTDTCTVTGDVVVSSPNECNSSEFYDEMFSLYLELGMMPVGHTCMEINKGDFE